MTFSYVVFAMFSQCTNSSQIYSFDYEDYFQLLATKKNRYLHVENEDEKNTVFRRQYLCALKMYQGESSGSAESKNVFGLMSTTP